MATYTQTENLPIVVDLTKACNFTGWSVSGDVATHDSCGTGYVTLLNYPAVSGHTYSVTFAVPTITSGFVQLYAGNTAGVVRNTPDIYVETIIAGSGGFFQFLSNGNCTLTSFAIRDLTVQDGVTIVFSTENKKWSDTRTLYPSIGISIFEQTVLGYQGAIYLQENGSDDRNNFFGTQYQSSIKFVEAQDPEVVNDYEAVNYICNMLLATTINGVQSSTGQVSTLIPTDFIKAKLDYMGLEVIQYQKDNVYSASFLPDSMEDPINGAGMRGNYIIIELITVDGSTPLQLFSVGVKRAHIPVGAR